MPRNPNSPPNFGNGPIHSHTSASENIKLQMMMAKLEDSLRDEFVLKEQLKTINLESLLGNGNIDIKSIDRIEKASEGLVDTYTIYFTNSFAPYTFEVTNGAKGDKGDQGAPGRDGATGSSGREITLQVADGHIQWKYVGEASWNNLIALEALKGADGTNGADGANGQDGEAGKDGANGRELELNVDQTTGYIQWRLVGDALWTNLIALESLKGVAGDNGQDGADGQDGQNGADGREIALTVSENNLVWFYKDDEGNPEKYNTLIALADLKGDKGDKGNDGESLTFEMLTEEQKAQLKGPQGPIGPQGPAGKDGQPLTYDMLTDAQKAELKGKDGVSPVFRILNNIWEISYDNGLTFNSTGVTAVGPAGTAGTAGKDGVGIQSVVINNEGKLIIYLTDGTEKDLGIVIGADGKDGTDGKDGQDGTNGLNGKDGLGIAKSEINANGELVLTYTNNTSANLGKVVGANGTDGKDGQPGVDGAKGEDGTPGLNGADGKSAYEIWLGLGNTGSEEDFINSLKGESGQDGLKGEDGKSFTFEDLTIDQKLELKGEQGPAGKDFTYDMFTPEQLEALRGPQGERGEQGPKGDTPSLEGLATLVNLQIGEDFTTDITIGHLEAGFEVKSTMTFGELLKRILRHPSNFCNHVWIDADCTTPKTCSICGQTEGTALGHIEEVMSSKAATCEETGLTEGLRCSRCGEILVEQQVIPALGHKYTSEVTLDPTCTAEGVRTYTCNNGCGETYTEVIPAVGHNYVSEVIKPATCAEDGLKKYTCTRCGDSYEEVIPKLEHQTATREENRIEPDCTNAGSYDRVTYCTECGEVLNRETITLDALGHTPALAVKENETAATCETSGSYDNVIYCTVCGEELSRETITLPALGHKAAAAVEENKIDADCETAGSYELVTYCSVCGEELSRETKTIPALGHNYGDWVITKEPEIEVPGEKTQTCSRCGHVITEEIPALPKPEEPSVLSYKSGTFGNLDLQEWPEPFIGDWESEEQEEISMHYVNNMTDIALNSEDELVGRHGFTITTPFVKESNSLANYGDTSSDPYMTRPAVVLPIDYTVTAWNTDVDNSDLSECTVSNYKLTDGRIVYYAGDFQQQTGATVTHYLTISKN